MKWVRDDALLHCTCGAIALNDYKRGSIVKTVCMRDINIVLLISVGHNMSNTKEALLASLTKCIRIHTKQIKWLYPCLSLLLGFNVTLCIRS